MTLPATEWRDTQGLNEYGGREVANLVDPDGNYIVDTDTNYVVDTGVTSARLSATEWSED